MPGPPIFPGKSDNSWGNGIKTASRLDNILCYKNWIIYTDIAKFLTRGLDLSLKQSFFYKDLKFLFHVV